MSETETDKKQQSRDFPATVVAVANNRRIVINRGEQDGVDMGDRFLVYALSAEEITDPTTGESLGRLEIPKGTGEVINTQPQMATIESDDYPTAKTVVKHNWWSSGDEEHITPSERPKPFQNAKKGDRAKPI